MYAHLHVTALAIPYLYQHTYTVVLKELNIHTTYQKATSKEELMSPPNISITVASIRLHCAHPSSCGRQL